MPLQFRRGTNAERLTITPAVGEPIWTTNTNRLYVGDGTTVGGVAVEIPLPSTGTFVSLTVTNLHFSGDPVGVNQTTAYTGTVAWSQIGSKPNGGLYTTSTVEFNQLSVTGSAITATQASIFINASTATSYEPPHAASYLLWGIEQSSSARLVTDTYSNTNGSVWTGRRARGTPAVPTALQTNDVIFRVAGTGFGTTEFENTSSGYIDITALENFTDGAHGTKISFNTTNVGTNDQLAALTVQSTGTVIKVKDVPATSSAVIINQSGSNTFAAPPSTGQVVWAISTDTNARVLLDNYSDSPFPAYNGRSARGTPSAPTAVQNGDTLVTLRGNGYGTTGFKTTSSAFINMNATENYTDTARGSAIRLYTTNEGEDTALINTTFRSNGVFVYTTASYGLGYGMLNVLGTGPNLARPGTLDDTLIHGVGHPGKAARIVLDAFGSDAPNYTINGSFSGRRASGTSDAPSAIQAGDYMTGIRGFGYGTSGFLNTSSAFINLAAAETFTDTAAGGKINMGVQLLGNSTTATQTTIVTIDQTGLTINYGGLTATNITYDNLYGGSGGNIQSYANISPNGTRNLGSLSAKWDNVWADTVNTTNLTFADATNQTTAWTGSVSTSSVTGLQTIAWTGKLSDGLGTISTSTVAGLAPVAWTNQYSDLTGKPNQNLNTGSDVQFNKLDIITTSTTAELIVTSGNATINNTLSVGQINSTRGLSVTTGTQITKTLSVGGYALNAAGTSSWSSTVVNSPTLIVSNTTPGQNAAINIRAFGQNNPNGASNTNANPNIRIENSFGTNSAPTTVTANQNLGGIIVGGYDGRNWPADYSMSNNFLGWYATETMTNDGSTSTLAAGSGFNIYVQPAWTRPGINQSRQRFIVTSWSTSTTAPSINNIVMGAGVDTTNTSVSLNGNTYIGPGRANMQFINSNVYQVGVPFQDTAPDNTTLNSTNIYTFVAGRRSGTTGRRDAIQSGDNLGGFNWNGQTANNGTQFGSQSAVFVCDALENFSSTVRGSRLRMQTTNSGTNILSTRFALTDQQNQYGSQLHTFYNTATNFRFMDISTSSVYTYVPLQFPDLTQQTTAWQPAYGSFYDTTAAQTTSTTTGLNTAQIGTTTTASGVTLVSNGAQVTNAGVYNVQMSIQFENSGSGAEDVVVWLRQNSTDLSNSSGVITVPGQHGGVNGKIVSSWNYILPASANDTFYLMWQPQSTNVFIATQTVGTGTPSAPGVIFTLVRER